REPDHPAADRDAGRDAGTDERHHARDHLGDDPDRRDARRLPREHDRPAADAARGGVRERPRVRSDRLLAGGDGARDSRRGALPAAAAFAAPFAFFGHSLGALVAYEVTRTLRARGRERPELLFLSAYPAPHLPRAAPATHLLPDAELLAVLEEQAGALPKEL